MVFAIKGSSPAKDALLAVPCRCAEDCDGRLRWEWINTGPSSNSELVRMFINS